MKRIYVLIACIVNAAVWVQGQPLTEMNVRNGLPVFFKRLARNDSITVLYFGGSITEAAGYRIQSEAMFREQYPGIRLRAVNAGLGGTGSDLGVFRLQHDVLQHQPALVFLEFAVNDFGTDSLVIGRSMEGIIRQIKKSRPLTDICLLYTLSRPMLAELSSGRLVRSMRIMERLADHYGLPSVTLASPVMNMLKNDQLVFESSETSDAKGRVIFSKDGVHPLAAGHQVYTAALKRSFTALQHVKKQSRKRLPAPLYAFNYEQAAYLSPLTFPHSTGWKSLTTGHPLWRFSKSLPGLLYTGCPADSMVIRFEGRMLGFEDILGPNSAAISISIDGATPIRIQRFDQYSGNHRRHYYFLDMLPAGKHTVVLRLDTGWFDKTKIVKPGEMGDPARFKENYLYIGKVLMIGTPLPGEPQH